MNNFSFHYLNEAISIINKINLETIEKIALLQQAGYNKSNRKWINFKI